MLSWDALEQLSFCWMEKDNFDSVTEKDYGKAIAVHAGAHHSIAIRNIAFKLVNDVDEKPFFEF